MNCNHSWHTWLLLQAMQPRAVHASFVQSKQAIAHNIIRHYVEETCANDPSAGSPTETLLRLLLPLSDKVH